MQQSHPQADFEDDLLSRGGGNDQSSLKDTTDAALQIQKIVRGRQGRKKEQLLRKRKAAQKRSENNSDVSIAGLSRGRKGRNQVTNSRAAELAEIRSTSPSRSPSRHSGGKISQRKKREPPKGIESIKLSDKTLRENLKTLGIHPILLTHAYLQLELPKLKLCDISSIQSFPNLMYLNIAENCLCDLTVLQRLPYLVQVNARKNYLTDCLKFSPPHCKEEAAWSSGHAAIGSILISADLSYNNIECIQDLSHHPSLECLILSYNFITDIRGVQSLQFLQVLDLSNNYIRMIQGLDKLPLRELNLSNNLLQTLHGLQTIETLSVLNVANNQIQCLAPLKSVTNLSYLDIQNNQVEVIREVEHLNHLTWLRVLLLVGNPCSRKPYYRSRVIFRIPYLSHLDSTAVSATEKVLAANLFEDVSGDVESRKDVFLKYFPTDSFFNYSPYFIEDEDRLSLRELEQHDDELCTQIIQDERKIKSNEAATQIINSIVDDFGNKINIE